MVTVKKLLHEIFTEDTIKVLAIGFMADDPREKSNYPSDMPYSEFKRLVNSKSVLRRLNDTEKNREKFRKAVHENHLKSAIENGTGLTETEKYATYEIMFSPRW